MDVIRNIYLHKYSHKMFYKKSSAQSTTGSTVTSSDGLRNQQFYIYSIDGRTNNSNTQNNLDLPPKYEDVIKDLPPTYRREVS